MKKIFWIAIFAILLLNLSSCWVDKGNAYYYKQYDHRHEHDRSYAHND